MLVVEKSQRYFAMDKTALEDERISWMAKGLYSYLLSRETAEINLAELRVQSVDSGKATLTALGELERCGYIKLVP